MVDSKNWLATHIQLPLCWSLWSIVEVLFRKPAVFHHLLSSGRQTSIVPLPGAGGDMTACLTPVS